MTKLEYNGWYNFETWNAVLCLSKKYGDTRYWEERADDLAQTADGIDDLTDKLADEIEAQFDEAASELPLTGFFADVFNASLREVNWKEIAEHMVSTDCKISPPNPKQKKPSQ